MLYLIELDSNYYKVGKADDINKRINSFKTSHISVELISSRDGGYNEEKEIHNALSKYNICGELYKLDNKVLEIFNSLEIDILEDKKKIKELESEIEKLNNSINHLKTLIPQTTDSEILATRKIERVYNGLLKEISIIYYKNCIIFGDSLLYEISSQSFKTIHNKPVKEYKISGKPHYYITTGIAMDLEELNYYINTDNINKI